MPQPACCRQHLQNHQRKRPALGLVIQHGVEHTLGEQAMHHLLDLVVADRSHDIFLAADAIGDAGEELQLILIAHFGTEDIVQRLDDFR